MPSVKRFRLKRYMSNKKLATALGVFEGENRGTFFSDPGKTMQVGSRTNEEIFVLHISKTKLHAKALEIADSAGES